MNTTNLCWIIMLNILSPNASSTYQNKISKSLPSRMKVCTQVAKEAINQNIDPILAVSIAYHESRFSNPTSSKGAKGPLGVLPQYHCPKTGKCDYTQAGITALKKWLTINKKRSICKALAQYNRGFKGKCKKGRSEYKYAQRVLDTYFELKYYNQEACFSDQYAD